MNGRMKVGLGDRALVLGITMIRSIELILAVEEVVAWFMYVWVYCLVVGN